MPKIVAVVQARMNSTRLPGKVLMDIGGKSALQWVIDAASAASLVGQVVVATPDMKIAYQCKGSVIIGPESNVLERFRMAAQQTGASTIVRLTADCPFLDPDVVDECIKYQACAVDQWPDGMDIQVIRTSWLPLGDREHVVPVNNNLKQLMCPAGNLRHIRVTLDTAEDLERCRDIAALLPTGRPPTWRETVSAYNRIQKLAA